MKPSKILIIQTAFLGDVILATALIEKIHSDIPGCTIDFLVRRGNEAILRNHPLIRKLLVWDKKEDKWKSWLRLLIQVRKERYHQVITLQRFASMGLFTVLSGAKKTTGFDKNPFSFLFSLKVNHQISAGIHELDRNHGLIAAFTNELSSKPRLYPTTDDFKVLENKQIHINTPFICVAPSSVWFSKTLPEQTWIEFLKHAQEFTLVYLIGSESDRSLCEHIANAVGERVISYAGDLSMTESSALISKCVALFANDSAPLHIASAMNVPTCAVFCSTHPDYGFGPVASASVIVQSNEKLNCRPCGLAGKSSCPEGHFKCGHTIKASQLINAFKILTQSKI